MSLFTALQGVEGVQFASLTYRTKATGEKARYTIILNANLDNAYKADLAKISAVIPSGKELKAWFELGTEMSGKLTDAVELQAACEIEQSLRNSLDKGIGNNDDFTLKGVYVATGIPSVFINANDNVLHLRNVFVQSKVVLEEGEPRKEVKSKPLTIAKDKLKKALGLRTNKLRQFALDNITIAKVNGDTITFE